MSATKREFPHVVTRAIFDKSCDGANIRRDERLHEFLEPARICNAVRIGEGDQRSACRTNAAISADVRSHILFIVKDRQRNVVFATRCVSNR